METFAYIEINVFALIILLLISMNMHDVQERLVYKRKLFIALLISCALQLVLDSILWILDGKSGILARNINIAATVMYFLNSPIPFFFWSLYVNYQVLRDESATRKVFLPLLMPVVISAALALLSINRGFIFYYDTQNIYHRGYMFILTPFIWFIYFLYTTIFLVIHRRKIEKIHFFSMLIFMFPTLAGGAIQLFYYGVSIIWSCLAISILIVFLNIQKRQLFSDYLSDLFNRRQLDYFLEEKINNVRKNYVLAGVMLDLNSLKNINDVYGHAAGDMAIVNVGKILKMSFKKNDMICRYGGDEFVVIFERETRKEVEDAIELLNQNARILNAKEKLPFLISFSIGYDIFDSGSGMTTHQFLERIDDLMYTNKKNSMT